jgi:hypothetical protein
MTAYERLFRWKCRHQGFKTMEGGLGFLQGKARDTPYKDGYFSVPLERIYDGWVGFLEVVRRKDIGMP